MTRSEELRALAEWVEVAAEEDYFAIVNKADDLLFDAGNLPVRRALEAGPCKSLDACAALHKAVLGERWSWSIGDVGRNRHGDLVWCANLETRLDQPVDGQEASTAETPARAWLAAILRAAAVEAEG